MSNSIDHAIQAAEVSLQMEGLSVTDACKDLCRRMLAGEITLEQYLRYVIPDGKDIQHGLQ